VSRRKFKIGQLVFYLNSDATSGVFEVTKFCRQKAKLSSTTSRTPTSPTSEWLSSMSFLARVISNTVED
jgi:hypothetical protein